MVAQKRRRAHKSRRKKSRSIGRQLFFGALILTFVVLIGYGVWYVTRLPEVTISDIHITGGETIPHEEIHVLVEEELSGSYLFVVPKRFSYLYPHDRITRRVADVPRIFDVSVEREDRNKLRVSFKEYVPYALWCSENSNGKGCMFLAADGYAFAPAPPLSGGTFIRHVTRGTVPEPNVQIFSRAAMERKDTFIAALREEFGFQVMEIVYTEAEDEIYRLRGGGELLVTEAVGVQTLFDNLRSILASEEFNHLETGNFKYIDLRFGNRVFVKEEEVSEVVATTTEEEVKPLPEEEQI